MLNFKQSPFLGLFLKRKRQKATYYRCKYLEGERQLNCPKKTMKIQIFGKNIRITQGIHDYVHKKLSKAEPFLSEDTPVNVIIRTVKNDQIIEVTIDDGSLIRAEERSTDLYTAIDKVEDKIIRILRKNKEKRIEKYRKPRNEQEFDEDVPEAQIVRNKEISPTLMMPEDAIYEMEVTDHDFFVYINKETEQPEVVYKRKDGKYGVLSVEKE